MDEMRQALDGGLAALGLDLPEEGRDTLCRFGRAVVEQNWVMNLTAITEPGPVARLHLLDSLTVLLCVNLSGKAVIDVGCGAGFPGVPAAIGCPEMKLTLLDSLGKRMRWLETVLPELGVEAECVTARAEEEAFRRRESFDCALSRAVARLNILLELTAPFVRVGGYVVAMKGDRAGQELAEAGNASEKLGLSFQKAKTFPIGDAVHTVLVFRKVSPTPPGYPRRYPKIKQKPL